MPGGFRRAQLQGSDELFRPTRPDTENELSPATTRPAATPPPQRHHPEEGIGVTRPDGRLVRLTDDEVELLTGAIQHLKYPNSKQPTKPPIDLFERLEELRLKLLDAAR